MSFLSLVGWRRTLLSVTLCLAALSCARAEDIIKITAIDLTLSQTVKFGFSSIGDAIDNFMGTRPEQFFNGYNENDQLDLRFLIYNTPFSVFMSGGGHHGTGDHQLSYAFTASDGHRIQRTFTGHSRDDVLDQLKDFFKSDAGQEDYAELMKAIQENNGGGPASGPQSSVGQQTSMSVQRAMGPSMTPEEVEADNAPVDANTAAAATERDALEIGVGFEYGMFKENGLEGDSYSIPISFGKNLNRAWKLHLGLPLNVTIVEGAYFYRFGQELALAWTVIGSERGSDFKWVITPSVSNYINASEDLYMRGDVLGYGLANRLEKSFGNWRFAYGTYFGIFESLSVDIGDYNVDMSVDETVWANGLKASYGFARRWVGDTYFIDTRSQDGVMTDYQSIGVGINYRAGVGRLKNKMFRVGVVHDMGDDYESTRMEFNGKFTF